MANNRPKEEKSTYQIGQGFAKSRPGGDASGINKPFDFDKFLQDASNMFTKIVDTTGKVITQGPGMIMDWATQLAGAGKSQGGTQSTQSVAAKALEMLARKPEVLQQYVDASNTPDDFAKNIARAIDGGGLVEEEKKAGKTILGGGLK